jgi:hypothetical protein
MFDLEQAISSWRKQMLAAGIKTPVPLEELESHLREEIERQMESRVNEQQAFEIALERIGQARILKNEFKRAEGMKEAARSAVKNFSRAALPVLPVIVLILNVGLACAWQRPGSFSFSAVTYPAARVISPVPGENAPMFQVPGHSNYSGVPTAGSLLDLYNRFAGRGGVPWWFQSVCIMEVLLFSLVLAFAAYFQTPKNTKDIRRQRRIFWIGQLFLGFSAAYGIFPPDPFFGLVMAVIICTVFVFALQRQSPAEAMSS